MNRNIIRYDQIDSTNTRMKELAKEGAAHGTVVVADSQTAGKGRRGRIWSSLDGQNLYMTILLRPQLETRKASMLTLIMAYSIGKVLDHFGYKNVQIKWPNDVLINKKKVCGILTEMVLNGTSIDYVMIGSGINVNAREFPEELSDKATSLALESGHNVEREYLLECILERFDQDYQEFLKCGDLSFLKEGYEQMLVNRNETVCVLEPEQEYRGVSLGINEQGELIVEKENGEIKTVYAGEVSVRGVYGYV